MNATRAEQNFEKIYNLACRWNAIILIDEADVFLESRGSTSSAGRNALVSVLLRVLEYSQGIIILTTNRVKSFDVAVLSRINLAIRYTDLSEPQIIRLYKYFLDQLGENWIDDRDGVDDFIKNYADQYGLNGRQIRNAVSGALALARSGSRNASNKKLTFRHLKDMLEVTKQFEQQLRENVMAQRYNNEVKG